MLDTTASSITYNGNGATTSFDYPFKIFAATEMEVWLTDAAGAETQLNSDNYTVSGVGDDAGGSVLYPVAGDPVATGEKLTLRRILAVKQDFFDPSNNTAFHAEVLETSADKTLAIMQQLKTDVDRGLRGSLASSFDPELPEPEAGKVLAWNVAEDALINLGVSSVLPEGTINTVDINDDAVTAAKIAARLALVNISNDDTTVGYLDEKLVAGDNLTLTVGSPAGNETLTVDKLFRGALVYGSGSQTITDGVGDAINFVSEDYDTNDFHESASNPERITIPAGVSRVRLSAQVTCTPADSGDLDIVLQKSGTGFAGACGVKRTSIESSEQQKYNFHSPVLSVVQNDYFELAVSWAADSSGDLTINHASALTWFAIEVVK